MFFLQKKLPMLSGFRKDRMLGKKVLIIDNDVQFLRWVKEVLCEVGAKVITAQDGLDGISKLITHQPDLILLDVLMPEKEGFQVCQKIRHFSTIPIIMLSAINHEKLLLQSRCG